MMPGAGAVYCGGGTEFAEYGGSVWLHAAAMNRKGNNAMLCFHNLMICSLGIAPLVIMNEFCERLECPLPVPHSDVLLGSHHLRNIIFQFNSAWRITGRPVTIAHIRVISEVFGVVRYIA
jgi:hypothetical protein